MTAIDPSLITDLQVGDARRIARAWICRRAAERWDLWDPRQCACEAPAHPDLTLDQALAILTGEPAGAA